MWINCEYNLIWEVYLRDGMGIVNRNVVSSFYRDYLYCVSGLGFKVFLVLSLGLVYGLYSSMQ